MARGSVSVDLQIPRFWQVQLVPSCGGCFCDRQTLGPNRPMILERCTGVNRSFTSRDPLPHLPGDLLA